MPEIQNRKELRNISRSKMKIGEKTIKKTVAQVEGLMREELQNINEAYLAMDDELLISLKVKIGPATTGVTVFTELSFTKEKVKVRSGVAQVDENQATLSFVGEANAS